MLKSLLACLAVCGLAACATHSHTFDDPVMAGMWARTELFRMVSVKAAQDDVVTLRLQLFDTETGKQVGEPVMIVKAGEPFGIAQSVAADGNAPVAGEGDVIALQGKVDITSDERGRRFVSYRITGQDRAKRSHTGSGTVPLAR